MCCPCIGDMILDKRKIGDYIYEVLVCVECGYEIIINKIKISKEKEE